MKHLRKFLTAERTILGWIEYRYQLILAAEMTAENMVREMLARARAQRKKAA